MNNNNHGGHRGSGQGFGRPRNTGTGRILKLKCTGPEWAQLKSLLPKNNRCKFEKIAQSLNGQPPQTDGEDIGTVRTIKLYATKPEWVYMHTQLPRDSRQKFKKILHSLQTRKTCS